MTQLFKTLMATIGVILSLIVVINLIRWLPSAIHLRQGRKAGQVGVLELSGVISGSSRFLNDLRDMQEDDSIKAIVVRINSPGGLVAPSQEIFHALINADKKTPVVASLQSVAASGGYYAALGARKIVANSGSLTGSIGVVMEFVDAHRLLDWAKLEHVELFAGKYKTAGSPFRKMGEEERKVFQELLNDVWAQFSDAVKTRRKIPAEQIEKVANGRVFTGSQAKTLGLVDQLGTFDDAAKLARKLAALPDDAELVYPESGAGALRHYLIGDEPEPDSISQLKKLAAFSLGQLDSTTSSHYRLLLISPIW